MYQAVILPLARQDIVEAASWYNSKQKGLGKRFTKEVRDKVQFLCNNPRASAMRYENTYCAVLEIFPFMIHYTIDDRNNAVIVAAVFHTAINPKRWEKR